VAGGRQQVWPDEGIGQTTLPMKLPPSFSRPFLLCNCVVTVADLRTGPPRRLRLGVFAQGGCLELNPSSQPKPDGPLGAISAAIWALRAWRVCLVVWSSATGPAGGKIRRLLRSPGFTSETHYPHPSFSLLPSGYNPGVKRVPAPKPIIQSKKRHQSFTCLAMKQCWDYHSTRQSPRASRRVNLWSCEGVLFPAPFSETN